MTKITNHKIQTWIKNQQNSIILYCGKCLCLCRYENQFIWRYKIRRKLSIKKLQTWQTIGIYPAMTLQEAQERANEIRQMLNAGFNPKTYQSVNKQLNKSFAEIYQLFYVDHVANLKPTTIKTWDKVMQSAQPIFNQQMSKITADDVHELINSCSSKSIAAALLQRIKQLFKWAKIKRYIKTNKISDVMFPYRVGIVERYLSPHEINKFYAKLLADDNVNAVMKVAIYSLLILLIRKAELLNIKWDDVDVESGRVVIQNSKAINGWVIKLPQQVLQLWLQLRELYPASVYVFCSSNDTHYADNTINREIAKLVKKYKVKKWTPHDLRRTGMTLLSEMGQRYEVINAALGHVVKGVNRHYLKSNLLDERTKLLQFWADYVDSIL